MHMDLQGRAHCAMEGFMRGNPEKTPSGHRAYFGLSAFPVPKAEHLQWDDGDGTARALDAWLYLRRMTGDYETGKEVELGQWKYLRHLLHPESGLPYVADFSYPNRDGYYYHLWDQGRTLRHLVNRYEWPLTSDREKREAEPLIRIMIDGLKHLSSQKQLPDGNNASYWTHEVYWNDTPVAKSDKHAFTIGNAQMLDPATSWAVITGSEEDLQWAIELANGFIAGLENRRESTTPMFGAEGEFYGHFHCAASGLTGLVRLARELILRDRYALGKAHLDTAIKAYSWIFSEENRNRGGSHGWFPESSVSRQSNISEICCTADMIELASALALSARLVEGYAWLDRYWDDVDRFARNELFQMQMLCPEKLQRWISPQNSASEEAFREIVEKFRGGWPFGHTWPHDLMDFDKDSNPDNILPDSGLTAKNLRVPIGGCCMYSGPRGLFGWWSAAVEKGDGEIDIRFPLNFEDDMLTLVEFASGGLSCTTRAFRRVMVRIPAKVDLATVRVFENDRQVSVDYNRKMNRVILNSKPGEKYRVIWRNPVWESHETLGPPNDGHIPDVPVGSRITYRLRFRGNRLEDMSPGEGAYLPYSDGL